MGPVVRSLTLKGFRSVPSGRIDFDNPTFLVGRNGSGKSNIADAFAFLAEAMTSPLQEVFDRRGGITSILHKTPDAKFPAHFGMAIEIDNGEILKNTFENFEKLSGNIMAGNIARAHYAFEITALEQYRYEINREQCVLTRYDGRREWFDRRHERITSNVAELAEKTGRMLWRESLTLPHFLFTDDFVPVLQILREMRVYSIEPARLREMQDPDSGTSLKRDGSNAASVLEEIKRRVPQNIKRIEQFLSNVAPATSAVSTLHHGQKLALQFTQQWGKSNELDFEAFSMSDGTLRAFGLLLAVFQRRPPSLMVVEEPEASIHPAAAGVVLDLLHHAAKEMQVVVSTHSPEILDAKWIQDKNLRIITWQNGATQISSVSELSKKALQQHLMGAGELLRSEALEPAPLFEDVTLNEHDLFEEVG